ncbi:hypothetical protein GCM10009099_05840 [Caenispirillum bisanense]
MIGDVVEDCYVEWSDSVSRMSTSRALRAATVHHVGRNLVEWVRPRSGAVVRKRLTGKHVKIVAPDGRDLVAAWLESE